MNNSLEDAMMKIAKDRSVSCAKNGKLTIEDEPWNFRLLKPESKLSIRNNSELILPHIDPNNINQDTINEYDMNEQVKSTRSKKLQRIINGNNKQKKHSINTVSTSQQSSYREQQYNQVPQRMQTEESIQNQYYFQIQNKIRELTNKIQKFKDINTEKEHLILQQYSALDVLQKKSSNYKIKQLNYNDPLKKLYIKPEIIQNSKVYISYLPKIQKIYSQSLNFASDYLKKRKNNHDDPIKIQNDNYKSKKQSQYQNDSSIEFSFSNQPENNQQNNSESQKQSQNNSLIMSQFSSHQQSTQKQAGGQSEFILNEALNTKNSKQSDATKNEQNENHNNNNNTANNKDIKVQDHSQEPEGQEQHKFELTPTIELEKEIRHELDKTITLDIQLKNQIKYYGDVKDYTCFLSKLFRYCLEIMYYGKHKARNDLPKINLTDQVRTIFLEYFIFKLEQFHVPLADRQFFKDIFHDEWSLIIDKQTLIEEVGGPIKTSRMGRDVMMRLAKFYNITNPDNFMQHAGVIFTKAMMSEHEDQVEQMDEIMYNVLFKNVAQKVNQAQFFVCKRFVWDCMFLDSQIKWETKVNIIQKVEKMRYVYFRELYGMDVIDDFQLAKSLVQYFKVKKPLLMYFKEPSKAMVTEFALLVVKTIFGFKTIKQLISYLRSVQNASKNYDEQFFCMLEYCFKEALKKFGINQSVYSEVSNKFYWIKIKSGVRNDFGWIFNEIDKLIDEVNSWMIRMINRSQFKVPVTEKQLCETSFLQYFLYTGLGNAFSVHDVLPAMQYFNVKSDVLNIWLKGIKRIMLVNFKMKAGDVLEFEMYMKRCFVDVITN